ncbi:MAG: porin [Hyphomicrobiales bacterium]
MKTYICTLFILLFAFSSLYAQNDTIKNDKSPYSIYIIEEEKPETDILLIRDHDKKKRKPRVHIHGQVDAQYDFITPKDKRGLIVHEDDSRPVNERLFLGARPAETNYSGFNIRRARLGVDVYLRKKWSLHTQIGLDLYNVNTEYGNKRDYLDYAYVQKNWKLGILKGRLFLGYKKVMFGMEENVLPFNLVTVERSIATNFFNGVTLWDYGAGRSSGYVCTPLGIGNRHTGVQWMGNADFIFKGLRYYLAFTSDTYNPFSRPRGVEVNRLSYYASLGYVYKTEGYKVKLGLNFAYRPNGIPYFPVNEQKYHSLHAFNPYLMIDYRWLHLFSEAFIGHAEHGQFIYGGFYDSQAVHRAENAPDANSTGVNALVSARLLRWMQPYFRFSYVNSGGAAMTSGYMKDISYNAPASFASSNWDVGHSYGAGANFFIVPGKLKLKAEYEIQRYTRDLSYREFINNPYTKNKVTNKRAYDLIDKSIYYLSNFRVQLQYKF